ncbi:MULTISPECIES: hypothetical protein [unclassified Frankia]|uniref:hypothetical protein n=1 Tax=unclassified Frankia TaxID=2632575 RepID=UPI002AD3A865|nr:MULTISPECIES: hypothetical protein [unclassified Frankia]
MFFSSNCPGTVLADLSFPARSDLASGVDAGCWWLSEPAPVVADDGYPFPAMGACCGVNGWNPDVGLSADLGLRVPERVDQLRGQDAMRALTRR